MKDLAIALLGVCLLQACGQTEKKQENTTQTAQGSADSSATSPPPKTKNCQAVVTADKLGKADVYQESAKALTVSITVDQDTSSMQVANGCYFNNTVTIRAAKKTGSQVFKRTLLKDDLLYFTKNDTPIEQAILQRVTYKPTFNSQRYITVSMRLVAPESKKTSDYLVTMNYFGEVIKVR
ncbi:hypothetical protein [Spirosoma radiotolerans]|uniref:Lipoprotein n=1 Tax=Spirosoma radiotolerans TaxID=1379870 RepID=A0A0E3V772_9BACT|nr:hypothetical protein [Spirosoma radiotolerans]AKD55647.1 hypothetical protein SD10_12805 [Spirosoma radiotolerans]